MALDIQERRPAGIDLSEHGRSEGGQAITLDARLFIQVLVYTGCQDARAAAQALAEAGIEGALYADLNDPNGIGIVVLNQSADYFVTELRALLQQHPFNGYSPRRAYTMFGRTYSIGYENDLEEVLIARPHRHVCNPDWSWAIWYPLRRTGEFEFLSNTERRKVLMEHGGIGQAYGRADHAHDVRLACFGLDRNDNDFVVGLLGRELHPLSATIERMRKTRQTAQYLGQMGPFFIGKALWQSAMP